MKRHILIVEDDAALLEVLTLYLERSGYRITTAKNGKMALNFLLDKQYSDDMPDVVLTDIKMPEMDGMMLIDSLHKHSLSVPVMVLTANDDKELLKEALRRGCYDFIEKPLNYEDILKRFNDVFARIEREKVKRDNSTEKHLQQTIQEKRANWESEFISPATLVCPHCNAPIDLTEYATASKPFVQCPECQRTVMLPQAGLKKGMEIGGFTLEERIGSGGMGEVWLAHQTALNRKVALKILSPALTSGKYFLKRFLQEVATLGKLSHPNIVTAFDAGVSKGIHYLAVSFVDGIGLKEKLKEEGKLSETEAVRICRDIADALRYAWNNFKLLHRDIKPANIMIDKDGVTKLMDMGISKSMTEDASLTATGIIIGSPYYMSPEQAKNEDDIDFRSDIYSLGATLYHLATGTVPFNARTIMNILAKHITEPLPDPKLRNPELSDQCAILIKKMMAKSPEDRHGSWEEVIEDMDRILNGQYPKGIIAFHDERNKIEKADLKHLDIDNLSTTLVRMLYSLLHPSLYNSGEKQNERKTWEKSLSSRLTLPVFFAIIILAALLILNIGIFIGIQNAKEKIIIERERIKQKDYDIRLLDMEKRQAVRQILRKLKSDARKLMKENKFKEAASVYLLYRGKYAKETKSERIKLAEECIKQGKEISQAHLRSPDTQK